jgi:HisA/HisF family protein
VRIIPVIDLRAGRAVRGRGGDRAGYRAVRSVLGTHSSGPRRPVRLSEPVALFEAYLRLLRPQDLYVADLDRIGGGGDNDDVVSRLALRAPAVRILWDGGLVDLREGAACGSLANLVPVAGTETLAEPAALARFGGSPGAEPPFLSLDLSDEGVVARSGSIAALGETGILRAAARHGVRRAILLFLGRVGTSRGLQMPRLERLREAAGDLEIYVGGGIARLGELRLLRRLGFAGALLATALHDGRISPRDLEEEGFLS